MLVAAGAPEPEPPLTPFALNGALPPPTAVNEANCELLPDVEVSLLAPPEPPAPTTTVYEVPAVKDCDVCAIKPPAPPPAEPAPVVPPPPATRRTSAPLIFSEGIKDPVLVKV